MNRANYQAYCWLQSCSANIQEPAFATNGWKWDDTDSILKPVWFKWKQLLPSLRRKRKKPSKDGNFSEDADAESTYKEASKKRKKTF